MTVHEMAKQLDLKVLTGADEMNRPVTGGYQGDLLSWVMGRAREGDAWLTVMGNLNAVAVALLCDAACIVLVEGASLDGDARERAQLEGIPILQSECAAFELGAQIAGLLE